MSYIMNLYDTYILYGRGTSLDSFQYSDFDSLLKTLDLFRIKKAFLVSFASFRHHFIYGNKLTFDIAKKDERLIPCPLVLSNAYGETGPEEQFITGLVKQGAKSVLFCPSICKISLEPYIIGSLFQVLEKFRLPVIIPQGEANIIAIATLAELYPQLPFICVSPDYRNRNLLPVLKERSNIYITIGAPFAPNNGLEYFTKICGSERILFSSNYPIAEPGAALGFLMYSALSTFEIENIAFRNMENLIQKVRNE